MKRLGQPLRTELGISPEDWRQVLAAADDAHLDVYDYCRLMVLAAAGMGGANEHMERAIDASFNAVEHAEYKQLKAGGK